MTQIKQHTQAWHQAKAERVGGSEIYALAHYYCNKELEQIGIDLVKEQPFQTALEIYLKVKFGIKEDGISNVNSEFGRGMEPYIVSRLNNKDEEMDILGSDDFIINEKVHSLACCSPDGYVDIRTDRNLRDFDDKIDISKKMGTGTLELKTVPYDFNFRSEEGTKWQYIFQLQWNQMICGHNWGMLACLSPKEKDYDNDFFKGKILGSLGCINLISTEMGKINQYYNLYTYIYGTIKPVQDICLLALDRFQKALDENRLPNISINNKPKLLREKKLLSCISPEKFGTLEADQQLDDLLNERNVAAIELLKIQTTKEALDCEIIKAMQDHIEVIGTSQKAKFDKRGTLRFNPINK